MIKRLLIGIDGSPFSFAAYDFALSIAHKAKAEVEALFVVDQRKTQIPVMYTGSAYDISYERVYVPPDPELKGFYDKLEKDIKIFAENCMEKCREKAKQAKVHSVERIADGFPAEKLSSAVRSCDMLVVGQKGENAQYKRDMAGSTTEDVVRRSPRPVLVCPDKRQEFKKILFPFDAGRSADNALRFFCNSFESMEVELSILTIAESEEVVECVKGEIDYLKKHNIKARIIECSGQPHSEIIERAEAEGSDVILIGTHGRYKIMDYILGSTTSHVVRKSKIPVLLVQ